MHTNLNLLVLSTTKPTNLPPSTELCLYDNMQVHAAKPQYQEAASASNGCSPVNASKREMTFPSSHSSMMHDQNW